MIRLLMLRTEDAAFGGKRAVGSWDDFLRDATEKFEGKQVLIEIKEVADAVLVERADPPA